MMLDSYNIANRKPSFGELAKAARERLRLTRPEVAKRARTTATTIYRYETNRQVPREDAFLRLARALDQPASYFGGSSLAEKSAKLELFEAVARLNEDQAKRLLPMANEILTAPPDNVSLGSEESESDPEREKVGDP